MTYPDALDLHGVAALLGVTYDWLQRHWRTLPGFPPPFLGGGKRQRPRWARASITDYMLGRRWAPGEAAAAPPAATIANDAVRTPPTDRVSTLLALAG